MTRGAAVAASDPFAQSAAETVLASGGGAADALVAAFFAAAGARPDVLFAPAVALVAGHAAGIRFFDGRSLQPGRGGHRPRGFVSESEVPDAARVPVPRAVAMALLLHSYAGRARLRDAIRPAIAAAQKASAPHRADLLRSIADRGLSGIRSREVARALIDVGGPLAGGTLTEEDLDELRPGEGPAREITLESGATVITTPDTRLPADAPTSSAHSASETPVELVVACDAWQSAAALAYMPAGRGIAIEALELVIAPQAIPVMRSVPRRAPGTPLPMPAPIAVLHPPSGYIAAVGFPGIQSVPDAAWTGILSAEMPFEAALERACAQNDFARALAALVTAKAARAYQVRSA